MERKLSGRACEMSRPGASPVFVTSKHDRFGGTVHESTFEQLNMKLQQKLGISEFHVYMYSTVPGSGSCSYSWKSS